VDVPPDYLAWLAFNVDGRELYLANYSIYNGNLVLPIDLSNNQAAAPIPFGKVTFTSTQQALVSALDPTTGKPVVYVPVGACSGDLWINVIDSDPMSQSFNTVIKSYAAGLDPNLCYTPYAMQITPDGKYAYVWYDDTTYYSLGLFNLTTGAFASYRMSDLGINPSQPSSGIQWISISPDGKWLMMPTTLANRPRIKVFDIASRTRPKPFGLITPVPVPGHGFPQLNQLYVLGNKLYAIDLNGIVVVFNFSPEKGDFREMGYFVSDLRFGGAAFSSDGAYLYVTDPAHDQVSVLKTALLASGKDALFTNLRAPYFPGRLAVSPAPPPGKSVRAQLRPVPPQEPRLLTPPRNRIAQNGNE
jgi:DNA-binding beta-propeller fold protein YncE